MRRPGRTQGQRATLQPGGCPAFPDPAGQSPALTWECVRRLRAARPVPPGAAQHPRSSRHRCAGQGSQAGKGSFPPGGFPRGGGRCCLLSPGLRERLPPCEHPRAARGRAPPRRRRRRRPGPRAPLPPPRSGAVRLPVLKPPPEPPAEPPEDFVPQPRGRGAAHRPRGAISPRRESVGFGGGNFAPQQARQKGQRCGKSHPAASEGSCGGNRLLGSRRGRGRGGSDYQLAKSGLWEMERELLLFHPEMC